jgi:hypothetical protein
VLGDFNLEWSKNGQSRYDFISYFEDLNLTFEESRTINGTVRESMIDLIFPLTRPHYHSSAVLNHALVINKQLCLITICREPYVNLPIDKTGNNIIGPIC